MVALPVLNNVRIASPCPVKWEDMTGTDRVRNCAQCNFNVFNLSDMTAAEAESLITSAQGRLCVTYFQRPDGTILTRDCPVGLRAARAALIRTASRLAAIASAVIAAVVVGRSRDGSSTSLSSREPFSTISALLNPRPVLMPRVAGELCAPPMPPAAITSKLAPASKGSPQ